MMSDHAVWYSMTSEGKVIHFNFQLVSELQNGRWDKFSEYLKDAFDIKRDHNGAPQKIIVSEEILHCLDEWLNLSVMQHRDLNAVIIGVITEILRSLRNCISNLQSQKYIMEQTNILRACDILFSKLTKTDQRCLCLKILLQFLINLISSYKEAAEYVHKIFYEKIKMSLKNGKHCYECSALIYNISLTVSLNDVEVINLVFDVYNGEDHNEFVSFFLENTVKKMYFWNMYQQLKMQNKIASLEILRHMQLQKRPHDLPVIGLEVLTNIFLNSGDTVFQIKQGEGNDMKIYEVSLILEILSSMSSDEYCLQKLQNKKEILINAGALLINIHKLGKVSENCFTPVQKLSEFSAETVLNDHPAFGFKADLMRLIGNLCWKNKEMQNLARTAELIPVILDCCNMDARNPFIIQWVILAVRNLCENNPDNQKLIAGLNQQGFVSSEVLNTLGITLHSDGDSCLKIVPFDSLKNDLKKN